MGDTLKSVKADTAQDFLDEGHKAMKSRSKLGETESKWKVKYAIDGKTKTIKSATFTLTCQITRVVWGGKKKADPDDDNEAAIHQIEATIKAHEEAHADGYEKAFKKMKAKLEQDLVGKTEKEANKLAKQMDDALLDACEDLHKTGGLIQLGTSSGKITVTEKAEGPGGCK